MNKFYTFEQNNSGGGFDLDLKTGIGEYVIIEAEDYYKAKEKAESLGIYFDGISQGLDCECCGDRWCEPFNNDGNEFPSIFGENVSSGKSKKLYAEFAFIHYLNGTIKKVTPK